MLKVVLLVSDELKQRYVAQEVSRVAKIPGIVIEKRYTPGYRWKNFLRSNNFSLLRITHSLILKGILSFYQRNYSRIMRDYFTHNGKPIPWIEGAEIIETQNINTPFVVEKVIGWEPDILAIFGTRIVKEELRNIPSLCSINVHTGLSPYYRGGESAFWCLYNKEPEYIGVTVHYLDAGIDSGDIIYTARPILEIDDNLATIECKLASLGAILLKEAIIAIEKGTVKKIPRWIEGKLYYNRMFTLRKRIEVERNLRRGLLSKYMKTKKPPPKTFPPPSLMHYA
ncbi:hypothetical protein J7K43_05555 [Candidatus Calescamantes bacterium]|nr:hypothetical protein [Candidatus Calescamantes bacterium]